VTLANLVALVAAIALVVYALTGGADFGGGVWDALARGPRKHEQRALIAEAITPIWEANHVWLILVVVLLFTCFPAAFARLAIVLHIPIALALVGIVARGSAFTFRAYDSKDDLVQRRWGSVFAGASVVTPLLLGVCIGAVASGRVVLRSGGFVARFVAPWLTPFALGVGVFALVLFAFLAAVYLTVEAREGALQEDFRRRALFAAAALFVAAFGLLLLSGAAAPRVRAGLTTRPWAIPLQLATGLAAVTAIWGLWTRQYRAARLAAAMQVALILAGWVFAQYPFLIPPDLSIADSAGPPITLRLVLLVLAVGAILLVPSLRYLFRVFKGRTTHGT
jgi:cytochrome d ubiquinol oxidase subunit II